ncbi:DUF2017 family protein [Mycetocola lacteus]|uniref:DUF2017 family protein n=1 Tax=Mycetocola lacteus TaxID=76637 RepID=A0A3L7AX95_9MICO|nr:DUF2017 family protein [Mycetocola lacteus]RLP84191.1 DUF2017 family protein [Mycetocola lacteus]
MSVSIGAVHLDQNGFTLLLEEHERAILSDLAVQLIEVLEDPTDPVSERLYPDAYPEDAEASAEFRRLTRGDLDDARIHGARLLADTIPADPAPALSRADAETVMRALGDLRQVLAERLSITTQTPEADPEEPLTGLYDWLGYIQESLVLALVRGDEESGRLAKS